jgi:hypothetical protein
MKTVVSLFVAGALLASASITPASADFSCTTSVSCTAPIPIPPTPPTPPVCTFTVTCKF